MNVWLLILLGFALVTTAKTAMGYVGGRPVELTLGSIGDGLSMRADAAEAYLRMSTAAAMDGITLTPAGPRAAFRTQEDQASLITDRGAATIGGYAAAVGYSPHQGGIAIDIITANATNTAFGWLTLNAAHYGFRRARTSLGAREPWHWEYRPS